MKNKIGINLYWQTVKQLAIPAAVLGASCLVVSVINMFQPDVTARVYTLERFIQSPLYKFYGGEPIAAAIAPALIVFMYLGSAVFTYMAFKHLNSRSSSDFYHSLAHTRVCGYISRMLAVLTWQYGIILITMAVSVITMSASGVSFDFSFIPKLTLSFMAGSTLIAGGIALAMSLTGNLMSNFMAALVILVLPRTLLYIADRLIIYANYYTFVNISTLGIFLNPVYNIPTAVFLDLFGIWEYYGTSETLIHMGAAVYTFVLGIIYLGLGLLGMIKRKSELAGNGVQNALMRHLLSALVALPFLVFAFYSTVEDGVYFAKANFRPQQLVLFIIIGLLVFITSEFILKRHIKSAFKSLPVFIAAGVAALALVFAQNKIALKIVNTVPEADEIEYISLDNNYAVAHKYKPLYTYSGLLTKDIEYKDETLISLFSGNLSRMVNVFEAGREGEEISTTGFRTIYCKFMLKNGKSIFRNVNVYEDTLEDIWEIISTTPEYKRLSVMLPPPEEVDDITMYYNTGMDEAYKMEFYKRFSSEFCELPTITKNEITNESYNSLYWLFCHSAEYSPYYTTIGNFTVNGNVGGLNFRSNYSIGSRVPEAAKFYMQEINSGVKKQYFSDIEALKRSEGTDSSYRIEFEVINFNHETKSLYGGFSFYYYGMSAEQNFIDWQKCFSILDMIDKKDLCSVGFDSPIVVITVRKQDLDPNYTRRYNVYAQLSMEDAKELLDIYLELYD